MRGYRSDTEEYQPPMHGLEYALIGLITFAATVGIGLLWLYGI